jgi:hypothetical protein
VKRDNVVLSPCQIVAWNLERIRRERGLTQAAAAKELEPYLGYRLSKAAFSQAEHCLHRGRIRRFDADEIVAFAQAFGVKVPYFFILPQPYFMGKTVAVRGKPGRSKARVTASPLDDHQLRTLAQGFSAKEARSMMRDAARLELKAIREAAYQYMQKHPDKVAPALVGLLPKEFHDQMMALRKTSVAEQARLEKVVETIRNQRRLRSEASEFRTKALAAKSSLNHCL